VKNGGKVCSTTLGCSVLRMSSLHNTCSGILNLKASPPGGQQLQQKDKKKRKAKSHKNLKSLKR